MFLLVPNPRDKQMLRGAGHGRQGSRLRPPRRRSPDGLSRLCRRSEVGRRVRAATWRSSP